MINRNESKLIAQERRNLMVRTMKRANPTPPRPAAAKKAPKPH